MYDMDVIQELNQYDLTQNQYEDCIQLILDKKNGIEDVDWAEIVSRYDLSISSENLRRVSSTIFGGAFVAEYFKNKCLKDKERTVEDTINSFGVETSINKDGTFSSKRLIEMNNQQSKDPDYIMQAHGFDSSVWEIISVRNNVRQAVSRQSKDGIATLYASFITVKPKDNKNLSLKKIDEFFKNLDRKYSLPVINTDCSYIEGDKLLLIDIADLHMNLLSSMFVTGDEYNCDIAEKLFFYVIKDILSRTKDYKFEEIIFTVSGDMLNGDNLLGSTTRGTPQDSDLHYYDACERLYTMTIKAIDILKEYTNKVNVIYVKGNHDEVTGYKLAKYIQAWFRNDTKVEVDYSPLARKYKLYGKTLMCFAHDGKVQKLPALIADEAREYWSQAETVEVFLQHLHTEQVLLEDNNIRIQRLPTISGRSKWSVDKGYKSKKQCKTFIFDKEDGLIDVKYTPINTNKINS